jgi:hypothetical protein
MFGPAVRSSGSMNEVLSSISVAIIVNKKYGWIKLDTN